MKATSKTTEKQNNNLSFDQIEIEGWYQPSSSQYKLLFLRDTYGEIGPRISFLNGKVEGSQTPKKNKSKKFSINCPNNKRE